MAVEISSSHLEHEGFVSRILIPYRRPMIVVAHALLTVLAYALAFLIAFDFSVGPDVVRWFLWTAPIVLVVRLVLFASFQLFSGLWQYVGMADLKDIIKSVTTGSLINSVAILVLHAYIFERGFPLSVLVLDWALCLGLVIGVRILAREIREASGRRTRFRGNRVLIVGAGDAGESFLRYVQSNPVFDFEIVGLIDDDPRKIGARLHGARVYGPIAQIETVAVGLDAEEIVLALPSLVGRARDDMLETCGRAGLPLKSVPSKEELVRGAAFIGQLREIRPEQLLKRSAVNVDLQKILHEVSGRRVLVTGAGGSIGSELCRQIGHLGAEQIIMLDRAESPLYFAQIDVQEQSPDVQTAAIVGDILDEKKLDEVFETFKPEIVYHAAAYKHVPLMQAQPLDAIRNNVFGTEAVAQAALRHGVSKFVLISTDKAVKPVGIMGMTKRLAEDLLVSMHMPQTAFVSVRFGNVLGSAGSVLPLFQRQIAAGGPVTVTDPDATRYFMIIAEAAQLVIQAGAMGTGGEVFFLDMGEPVKIIDLARDVITLSGLKVGRDVDVTTIGLRPGERMDEQLVRESESLTRSAHEKIFLAHDADSDPMAFFAAYETLRSLVESRRPGEAVEQLQIMAAPPEIRVRSISA